MKPYVIKYKKFGYVLYIKGGKCAFTQNKEEAMQIGSDDFGYDIIKFVVAHSENMCTESIGGL